MSVRRLIHKFSMVESSSPTIAFNQPDGLSTDGLNVFNGEEKLSGTNSAGMCQGSKTEILGYDQKATKSEINLIMLGMTGDGKSNLASWLIGQSDVFAVSDKAQSCTDKALFADGLCFGGLFQGQWAIADTPGLSDSQGRDANNLRATIKLLKEDVRSATAFVMVVNATQVRMTASLQSIIKVFRGCFGPQLWRNFVVVFTRWDWRNRWGEFSQDALKRRQHEYKSWLQELEQELNGRSDVLDWIAEIRFFGVDLPDLKQLKPEQKEMLVAEDEMNSKQLNDLYNHLYITLPTLGNVGLRDIKAETSDLHEELQRQLQEEREAASAQAAELAERDHTRMLLLERQIMELERTMRTQHEDFEASERITIAERQVGAKGEIRAAQENQERQKREAEEREREREARMRQQELEIASREREARLQQQLEMERKEHAAQLRQQELERERREREMQQREHEREREQLAARLRQPAPSTYCGSDFGGGGSIFDGFPSYSNPAPAPSYTSQRSHTGPRCKDGSLDMRYKVNRGLDKHFS
eukprot:TRINITY_DN6867_c0_g1_i2.p1 TRINITY_DN6867_c0_g1~~TRINITY_DN6867_c0_g1_i2.p1  ORF type:complete len:549 (-),score=96.63 TRINITY_DN6867_c0_g1_i2:57-1649(-)